MKSVVLSWILAYHSNSEQKILRKALVRWKGWSGTVTIPITTRNIQKKLCAIFLAAINVSCNSFIEASDAPSDDCNNVALFSDQTVRGRARPVAKLQRMYDVSWTGCYKCTEMNRKQRNRKFAIQRRHLLCCKLRTNHVIQIKLATSKIKLHLLTFY